MMTNSCNGGCEKSANEEVSSPSLPRGMGGFASVLTVPQMDCPSEERMIRLAVEAIDPAVALEFDTPNRKLTVFYGGNFAPIQAAIENLGLGATVDDTRAIDGEDFSAAVTSAQATNSKEAGVLKWLLAINALMFGVEISIGWVAQSTGLIADSLDMFADAAVYGLALYAVGHSAQMKLRAAHFAGWLQMLLALGALSEVIRRFLFGSEPESMLMMSFGCVALAANALCLVLIAKQKDSGAHMKASWIFSANDVIANLGVIGAGLLVALTGSRYPDLVIGFLIGLIVLNGARRILQLKS